MMLKNATAYMVLLVQDEPLAIHAILHRWLISSLHMPSS